MDKIILNKLTVINKKYFLIFLLSILVTFVSYYSSLGGPYIADDYSNLLENNSIRVTSLEWSSLKEAAFSSPSSQYYRPISMLSFALNYYFSEAPFNFPLKLFNLILHIICGIGFYLLNHNLLFYLNKNCKADNHLIAVSVAALWLLHPLFVTTVLYTVQRMAILSTLFIVFGCITYIKLRENLIESGKYFYWLIFSIIIFTFLAFFSKENGALLCGFLLLLEYFLFQFKFHSSVILWKKLFLKLTLFIPVLFIFSYLIYSYVNYPAGELEQYYFSLNDRVLTQFHVMWKYVGWLFLIDTHSMGFHHDDIVISTGLFKPLITCVSIAAWLIVLILCAYFIKSLHILVFGTLWFLWGHILESTVLPLVPVYEHRNYLPGFGLILMFVWSVARFSNSININRKVGSIIFVIIVFLFPASLLNERVGTWQDEKTLAASLLKHHPESPATFMWAALFLSEANDYENAIAAIRAGERLMPHETAFIATETKISCRHASNELFPAGLSKKLNSIPQKVKPTMLLKIQLSMMIDACANSVINKQVLYSFYDKLTKSNNQYIQFLAYYGRGITLIHKGENKRAIKDWNQAYNLYPNRVGLKKAIQELETKN